MSLNALEMKDVSFSYDHQMVLEDINFTIEEKDFVAILGPNGGGKSTLLKIVLGLLTPDKGVVKIFGKEPKKALDMVGYLPQHSHFDLDFPIDVFQTVLMGRYHGLFKDYNEEDREIALQALKDVDMLDFKDRQISRLSGGQLQRVLIARALARKPKIFLMDEPMASIDPEMQNSFYELISRLKGKVALVLVSHDVGTVSMHMDKIACLNQKLYYHGPTEGAGDGLEEMYHCSIEQISHGIPHRMLRKH
ncbi:MAG TPA: ABC transporter ATP-binding protein [Methanobacterium sp.]|jgi:zinc transport system ATP-binding protein|nr:MAG: ABC transporter ATP-binding protein [Methanobacterium sp.]HOI39861.1 ABC transporter ATP-binding protein [Methanobacterium sp.]HOI71003.1 ABC transporter ATP-binding protein [Methanobacterium sp.]